MLKNETEIEHLKTDVEQKKVTIEFLKSQMKGNFLKDVLPLATLIVTLLTSLVSSYIQSQSIKSSIQIATYSSTVLAKQQAYSKLMDNIDGLYLSVHDGINFEELKSKGDSTQKYFYELEFFLPDKYRQVIYTQVDSFVDSCFSNHSRHQMNFQWFVKKRDIIRQTVLNALNEKL